MLSVSVRSHWLIIATARIGVELLKYYENRTSVFLALYLP